MSARQVKADLLYIAPDLFSPDEDDARTVAAVTLKRLRARAVHISPFDFATTHGAHDLAVADFRGTGLAPDEICGHAATIREQTSGSKAPLLFLVDARAGYAARAACKKFGAVFACGDKPEDGIRKILGHLESFTLLEECANRLKTLKALNQPLEGLREGSDTPNGIVRVLMTGPAGAHALTTLSQLEQAGFDVCAAMTSQQAMRFLEAEDFDCLVLTPDAWPATLVSLVKLLRRNERARDLPVIVLPDGEGGDLETLAARFIGGGANILLSPAEAPAVLKSEVRALARRSRLKKSLRSFLRKTACTRPDMPGRLSDQGFFRLHFARQQETARLRNKPLSLSAIEISGPDGHLLPPRVLSEACEYVEMLLQDVELMCQSDGRTLLLSHPGLTEREAARNTGNITEVLTRLQFRLSGTGHPVSLSLAAASCAAVGASGGPEDDFDRFTEILRQRLKPVPGEESLVVQRSAPELYLVQ